MQAEVMVPLEIIDNHLREVMHIHDHVAHALVAQAAERDLEQCAAGNFD